MSGKTVLQCEFFIGTKLLIEFNLWFIKRLFNELQIVIKTCHTVNAELCSFKINWDESSVPHSNHVRCPVVCYMLL